MGRNGNPDPFDTKRTARREAALPEHFRKRLTTYAAAAGASCVGLLGLAQPAEADIIVNNNPISIPVTALTPIQINGNNVCSFFINEYFSYNIGVLPGRGRALAAGGFVPRLAEGAVIGPGGPFSNREALLESRTGHLGYLGQWLRKSGFMGFEFPSNGQYHFGWAHLDVFFGPATFPSSNFVPISASITGFAFDTVANQPIEAGQTTITPEPDTLGLLALGSLGLGYWRRRKAVTSDK